MLKIGHDEFSGSAIPAPKRRLPAPDRSSRRASKNDSPLPTCGFVGDGRAPQPARMHRRLESPRPETHCGRFSAQGRSNSRPETHCGRFSAHSAGQGCGTRAAGRGWAKAHRLRQGGARFRDFCTPAAESRHVRPPRRRPGGWPRPGAAGGNSAFPQVGGPRRPDGPTRAPHGAGKRGGEARSLVPQPYKSRKKMHQGTSGAPGARGARSPTAPPCTRGGGLHGQRPLPGPGFRHRRRSDSWSKFRFAKGGNGKGPFRPRGEFRELGFCRTGSRANPRYPFLYLRKTAFLTTGDAPHPLADGPPGPRARGRPQVESARPEASRTKPAPIAAGQSAASSSVSRRVQRGPIPPARRFVEVS